MKEHRDLGPKSDTTRAARALPVEVGRLSHKGTADFVGGSDPSVRADANGNGKHNHLSQSGTCAGVYLCSVVALCQHKLSLLRAFCLIVQCQFQNLCLSVNICNSPWVITKAPVASVHSVRQERDRSFS